MKQNNINKNNKTIKFIDLFAGMGGIRLGFEQAFNSSGIKTKCVLTSEIKPSAIKALQQNFNQHNLQGDIRQIRSEDIPDFDFLLAGFPCQAFSSAGKGLGFLDTRGTLFFEVERILRDKKPYGFILENVEGLITHDKEKPQDPIGRTFSTILNSLQKLGYKVSWKLLKSQHFGVAQIRKRVFIVGTKDNLIDLENFKISNTVLKDVLETNLPTVNSHFTKQLLKHYKIYDLHGKSIKDKRGGNNNIHSWYIDLKGKISLKQKQLMEKIFKERRKKHWADEIGVKWMDGMPLNIDQIRKFFRDENLEEMLEDLVTKGYLVKEYPKQLVKTVNADNMIVSKRIQDKNLQIGYNIVAGKLSFEFTRILDSNSFTPTLVATDVSHIGVIDNSGIRKLTIREGLRLFGYPESYKLTEFENDKKGLRKAFDLLGNTVVVPVVKAISQRIAEIYLKS
ncbi:DNA (cytosine-5-)-methyltransferase [Mycoplasma nasistruthionis]|uniref:Cytosine-specific methyltransferase n=1 Tax=Mycoplasma nasistruthionis TaxID=353852 RepID=A0A4Y6I554_9MOLU|nr:DNA (cytosine-5-)-methyltransferase [Mycoplasma nasistruthionis]QDF64726.1 DNA (cytosine-5-)-methyltransferase [Mycoplasma nasistruthionis]